MASEAQNPGSRMEEAYDPGQSPDPNDEIREEHFQNAEENRRGFPPLKLASFTSGPVATITALGSISRDEWLEKQMQLKEVTRKRKLDSGQADGPEV